MQPYLFPYFGYYKLMATADVHIIYDDVNFIKKGFINRNKTLTKEGELNFNLEISKISQNKKINEHYIYGDNQRLIEFLKHTISDDYRDFKNEIIRLTESSKDRNLADYLVDTITVTCKLLGISTKMVRSSELEKTDLRGQQRIVSLVKHLDGKTYLNLPGGRSLYDYAYFQKHNIDLQFLDIEGNLSYEIARDDFYQSILGFMNNRTLKQVRSRLD